MKKVFIVANLKSYKNENEAKNWLEEFKNISSIAEDLRVKEIIICPSFTLLSMFNLFVSSSKLPVKIGAQNVSQFDEGAYTGEINAKQIKDFAEYVIIGHSERRTNFNESDDVLFKKVNLAINYQLSPIFCIQSKDNIIPKEINMVAYEPVFAIGTGIPDTPENADSVASFLRSKKNYLVLYGGSVTAENVRSFTSKENLNGVLVGGASLEAKEFIEIIKNA